MNDIGKPERATQKRVIVLFCDELGYDYLGDWSDRPGNRNIEETLLKKPALRRADGCADAGLATAARCVEPAARAA